MTYATSYCISRPLAACANNSPCWSTTDLAARSAHSGGVNVCLADGSVRFVQDTISLTTWQALGSINGGEVLAPDF